MRSLVLLLMALLLAAQASGATIDPLMQRYETALQHEDLTALADLIAPQASIHLTFQQAQQQMTFTLTRDEFLQQQSALWYFSRESNVSFSSLQQDQSPQGEHLHFQQQSRYALFHQDYRLQSDIKLTIVTQGGKAQITAIDLLTQEK